MRLDQIKNSSTMNRAEPHPTTEENEKNSNIIRKTATTTQISALQIINNTSIENKHLSIRPCLVQFKLPRDPSISDIVEVYHPKN